MRELIEDAVITYRQDGEGLLTIAAPAILLGPILVLIGTAGLFAALLTAPLIAVVYVATYAACVRAAGLISSSEDPDPLQAYLSTLDRGVGVARTSVSVALLFAAAVGLWLPFVALTVTASCERFVDEVEGEAEPLPAGARSY